jgi:hypothetical protein
LIPFHQRPITTAQLLRYQEQQRARAQKIQSTILLNASETSKEVQQWFQDPPNDNIVANIGLSLEEELSSLVSRDTKKDLHSSVR